ncbi:hypothetical protein CC78DRAFT_574481 [Lojkania enalia]|uniref:Uncharacterized protein n=1 Tax=Lojkania enalia TaxID=147567 RepID=A0A9P4TQE8_9PLEO|nr:hypothetical protein CC78DRAFT_574481 [Didymosphaeria enalia]
MAFEIFYHSNNLRAASYKISHTHPNNLLRLPYFSLKLSNLNNLTNLFSNTEIDSKGPNSAMGRLVDEILRHGKCAHANGEVGSVPVFLPTAYPWHPNWICGHPRNDFVRKSIDDVIKQYVDGNFRGLDKTDGQREESGKATQKAISRLEF